MPETWQKETRETIWRIVRADDFFRNLGGTQFDFGGKGLIKRLEIEPAHCPVLAIGPAGGSLATICRSPVEADDYRIAVQCVTAGQDVGDCERMVLEFCRALQDNWATLARLRGNRLYEMEPGELAYALYPSKKDPMPLWNGEFVLICRYRQA